MLYGNEFAYLYTIRSIDYDGSWYYITRECVRMLPSNHPINHIIDEVRKQINTNTLYIKGNWLYFIYKGVRYEVKVSSFCDEYMYIKSLIYKLDKNGCSCIFYTGGELD